MEELGRDFGPQPVAALLEKHKLSHHDLVEASTEQLSHKMVTRACNGRMLTRRVQLKVRNALNAATGENYSIKELFNYV